MPVISTVMAVAFAATVLALPLVPQPSYARVIVRHAQDLKSDSKVAAMTKSYAALSAANVIFSQCGTQRQISNDMQEYLAQKFRFVSETYASAFQDAYIARVKAPPSKAMVEDIASVIAKEQEIAVNNTAQNVKNQGCKFHHFTPIVDYVQELYKRDTTPVAPKPVDVPTELGHAPATVSETPTANH